jgi:hypothetical protein
MLGSSKRIDFKSILHKGAVFVALFELLSLAEARADDAIDIGPVTTPFNWEIALPPPTREFDTALKWLAGVGSRDLHSIPRADQKRCVHLLRHIRLAEPTGGEHRRHSYRNNQVHDAAWKLHPRTAGSAEVVPGCRDLSERSLPFSGS